MEQKTIGIEGIIEDLFSRQTPYGWITYAEYDIGYFDKIIVQYKNYFNDKQLLIARRNHSPLSLMAHFAFNNDLRVKHADYGKGIREDHRDEEKKRIPVISRDTGPVGFGKAKEAIKSELKGEYRSFKSTLDYLEEKVK